MSFKPDPDILVLREEESRLEREIKELEQALADLKEPTMHPDARNFLNCILENPDDDAPRFMYSDWLTEHGNPYGEFIRMQIGMEKRDESFLALKEREKEVRRSWDANNWAWFTSGVWDTWSGPITLLPSDDEGSGHVGFVIRLVALPSVHQGFREEYEWRCTVKRGFISKVECDRAVFIKIAPYLFAHHPVQEVVLTDVYIGYERSRGRFAVSGNPLSPIIGVLHQQEQFDSLEDAEQYISTMCIRHGRKVSGLFCARCGERVKWSGDAYNRCAECTREAWSRWTGSV